MQKEMNLEALMNWRYATKSFDENKKISAEDEEQLKNLLRMSASSINSQPWHFVIAKTDAGKERMAKGTAGFFSFNAAKVKQASHVILFCAKTDIDHGYLEQVTEKEDADGRFANSDLKAQKLGAKKLFTDIHRFDLKDAQHWMEKQVYLNLGSFLLGAASLGIDAVPMEGIDMKALDEEFGLREQGYTALVMVGLGYRAQDDFNAALPKSRLSEDTLFDIV
ncbi:oxygen-insensitive NAD(P)H nitroreductase [Mesonia sp. HuA40]|uniref:oxygen-insensitive NAD(P)H nitroreductase n=1 Tax=Mesonia sp. HuA40 TaxID=2602761 RepID=UPI002106B403|nr:oxygen-insensitive NAD(P)H nitroreductase [Mesonia sp. HuA40]